MGLLFVDSLLRSLQYLKLVRKKIKPLVYSQSGFNRVEVLVLAVIIIVLVLVFLNFVLDTQKSIRDTRRRGDIETIARALDVHFNREVNQYCTNSSIDTYCPLKSEWFTNNQIPVDPVSGQSYLNLPKNNDKSFLICAKLERENSTLKNQPVYNPGPETGYYYCSSSRQ